MIKPLPVKYRGVRFASTLEADWAATFDRYGIYWEYEPVAVELPDGTPYRPDFYLPALRTWCEVKGPHNQRIEKAAALQAAAVIDEWEWTADLVVLLRPAGPDGTGVWEGSVPGQNIAFYQCPVCEHFGFVDHNGHWSCRIHMEKRPEGPSKFWTADGGGLWWSGEIEFVRAKEVSRVA